MSYSPLLASPPERVCAPWRLNWAMACVPRRKAMPMQLTTVASASVVASTAVEP